MGLQEANRIARAAERVRRRARMSLKVAVPTAAALGAGAAVAVGSIPGSNGTITGCYLTNNAGDPTVPLGELRVIDPAGTSPAGADYPANACAVNETTITWNQQGPPGVPGTPGAAGAKGETGSKGDTGSATINGDTGLTVEKSGGTRIAMTFSNAVAKGDAGPSGQLDLDSFSVGLNQVVASSGAASKASLEAFTFVAGYSGKLFGDLVQEETKGPQIREIDVAVERATKGKSTTVETFQLRNAQIKHITQSGKKLEVGGVFTGEMMSVGSGDNKVSTKLGTVTTTGWDLKKNSGA